MILRGCLLSALAAMSVQQGWAVPDTSFDQIISHQAVYADRAVSPAQRVLPFETPVQDTLYDANGFCFVALTADGLMWSSRRKEAWGSGEDPPGPLENPYSDWIKVADLSRYVEADGTALLVKRPDSVVLATSSELLELVMDFSCRELVSLQTRTGPLTPSWGEVSVLASDSAGLWMGARGGMLYVDTAAAPSPKEAGLWSVHAVPDVPSDAAVSALLWVEPWSILLAGTADVLYELRFSAPATAQAVRLHEYSVRQEWIQGNLDSSIDGMIYDAGADCVWAVERDAVHKRLRDGSWWRGGFYQGASTDNITAVALDGSSNSVDGYIWMGTEDRGLVRMLRSATDEDGAGWEADSPARDSDEWLSWQLYYGPRFTPDGSVRLLVSDAENAGSSSSVVAVTENGVTFLTTASWKLSQKAEIMQSFQYPRHDRNGIVAQVQLANYGDLSSYSYGCQDSDSIWTGQYAVAAAMRSAVTGDESARRSAWRTFEALEMLGNITGVPGLVGRSMCSPEERAGRGDHPTSGCGDPTDESSNWHASETMPGWVWKGDTSSDTVNGHYFAYGLILDHAAVTEEEKTRAVDAIDRLTSYIVENDLYYVDITGEPTKWGRWNPADLNENSQYVSERGVNSLEIMGFLALAYSVTEKKLYYDTFQDLAQKHGYYENILNQKIDNPYDDNHSDNELGFMGYHTLFYAYQRLKMSKTFVRPELLKELEEMTSPVVPSMRRWYTIVRNERNPLWLAGVAGAAGVGMSQREVQRSVASLQLYSADMIDWGVRNSGRWDCVLQPYYSRDDPTALQMSKIRPPQERITGHYNSNPFSMDTSYDSTSAYDAGGGFAEYSPAEWLLPYWMLRFYGLLD